MTTLTAIGYGLQGIQRGMEGLKRDAAQIASARAFESDSPTDLVDPLVNLSLDRLQVEASAKVLFAVLDTVGTLLDTKA